MKMTWKSWEITIPTHNYSANSQMRPLAFLNIFRYSEVYACVLLRVWDREGLLSLLDNAVGLTFAVSPHHGLISH